LSLADLSNIGAEVLDEVVGLDGEVARLDDLALQRLEGIDQLAVGRGSHGGYGRL
jgi:hypothetical protein